MLLDKQDRLLEQQDATLHEVLCVFSYKKFDRSVGKISRNTRHVELRSPIEEPASIAAHRLTWNPALYDFVGLVDV